MHRWSLLWIAALVSVSVNVEGFALLKPTFSPLSRCFRSAKATTCGTHARTGASWLDRVGRKEIGANSGMSVLAIQSTLFRETEEDLGKGVRISLSPWREAEEVLQPPPSDRFKSFRAETSPLVGHEQLGRAAREIIDENLERDGLVLFRGLPLQSAEEFRVFWDACVNAKEYPKWQHMQYEPFGEPRTQRAGVDLATNTPPGQFLAPHNEMIYNPHPNDVIALYCLQRAEQGGENILCWNRDYITSVPPALKDFVIEHGGISYERRYHDESRPDKPPLSFLSWQERCALAPGEGKAEAEQYWQRLGFKDEHIVWGEQDGLLVRNIESGFVPDRNTGAPLWFNAMSVSSAPMRAAMVNLSVRMGDGLEMPFSLVEELKRNLLAHSYALQLQHGDWIVLDNLQVQHGRAPYVKGPEPRTVLTVYAKFVA